MPAEKPSRRQQRNAGAEGTRTPRKLNREVIKSLSEVLEKGTYIETAAAYVGVHKDTFFEWMKKGRRDIQQGKRSLHRDLVETIEVALAKFEVTALDRLGGEDQWQATAWRLERRFPEKFGRRSRVDHGNAEDKPFQMRLDISALSDEELDQLQALLEKGKPADASARRPADS